MRRFVAGFIILLVGCVLFLGRGYSANDWTDNPFVVDATEDKDIGGYIQLIVYHPDETDDVLDIQDAGGGQLFLVKVEGDSTGDYSEALIERAFNPPRATNGIYVKRIGDATSGCSGTVYIHMYKTRN